MSVILLLLAFACFASAQKRIVQLGPNFWNVRAHLVLNGEDIGTQMSFVRLANGRFLVIDTVEPEPALAQEIDALTNGGALMEAVIATHPFHTLYFPDFYAKYPQPAYYGTPRHLRIQPQIPWVGSTYDCATRALWAPEVRMRIPRGSEFDNPWPESNHFTGIHVFHNQSKVLYVDDTIVYNFPNPGDMDFHPTLPNIGLYHIPAAPYAFRDWVRKYINDWDFDSLAAAHNGVKIGGAKAQLQKVLTRTGPLFDSLTKQFGQDPNSTQQILFEKMNRHEDMCQE